MEERIKIKEATFDILIIIGTLLLVFGLFINSLIPKENRVYTTGEVIGIDIVERKGKNTVYAVIEYEINGEKYQEKINTWIPFFRKGSEIEILYDRNDYKNIQSKLLNSLKIINGIVILTIGTVGRSIKERKRKKLNER